jgi:hypothetical protein
VSEKKSKEIKNVVDDESNKSGSEKSEDRINVRKMM